MDTQDAAAEEAMEREIMHRIELISLTEICTLLGLTMDRQEILRTLTTMTPEIVEAEEAVIVLLSEDRDEMLFSCGVHEESEELTHFRLKYGKGVPGWVIHEGKPAIINDPASDSRFKDIIGEETGFITRNLISVPIRLKDGVIGALCVANKKDSRDFEPLDLKLCEAVAGQAGVAIERAALMEENIRNARLAAVGETVAGLAHCMKNILSVLKGGEFVVERSIEKNDPVHLKEGWKVIRSGVDRISDLVLDMLAHVKEREPEYSEVDPGKLVADSIELLREFAQEKGAELKFSDSEAPGPVSIDKTGIFRCLLNLIKNGIEACCEKGGTVTVALESGPEGYFTLRVSDTGCGMDEAILHRIFTRFFTTKGSKGTGLGLIVVDKIVKEHGGLIEVSSTPGEGTTFCLRIPRGKKT